MIQREEKHSPLLILVVFATLLFSVEAFHAWAQAQPAGNTISNAVVANEPTSYAAEKNVGMGAVTNSRTPFSVSAEDNAAVNNVPTNAVATNAVISSEPISDETATNSVATNAMASTETEIVAEGQEVEPVSIQGDQVEFSMKENKVIATGNVVVTRQGTTLTCDRLEYYRETKIALAEGNVVLTRDNQRFTGDKMRFDYETMKGDFEKVKVAAAPFYGAGDKISKVGDNHMHVTNGYLTTSDFDNPEYRMVSKSIDIYPGDKAVAKNVKFFVGGLPILYLPRYTQDLKRKEPVFVLTPGYDKHWGPFLLTQYRHSLNDDVRLNLHLDLRQRKGVAEGFDIDYKTKKYGSGLMRTYYMNERNSIAKYPFEEVETKPVYRERFKGEWRHQWQIDNSTNAVWQYYKLSDSDLLKDYFEREYEKDENPPTYFVLTRGLPTGTLSLRTDVRVNRFTSIVERLPEVAYTMPSRQLGESKFYLKDTSSFAYLVKKNPVPSDINLDTKRFDTDNELSRPFKLSIFELRPYVGQRETYYSKTNDLENYNSIRSIFRTGADISTKFFKIYDVNTNKFGLDINRLRHVITPSVAYLYQHDPTTTSDQLDQFDDIDNQNREHKINLSLENKLQTKREGQSVDLVRVIVGTDFLLKEALGKGGFNNVKADIETKPYSWLSFYFDSEYDSIAEHLKSANFDVYISDPVKSKWYLQLGKRYDIDADDQITSEVGYQLNQKWALKVYQQYDLSTGSLRDQEYSLIRDLHSWSMNLNFRSRRGEGDEIFMVFTLKAFPELGFDFGTGFNKRKPGAQTTP